MKSSNNVKSFGEFNENLNISDVSDSKIIEIESFYDFDKTYLTIEKESEEKVRLKIKSGYRGGEELDIVVDINKLKSIL
jgi:hypothetical protein